MAEHEGHQRFEPLPTAAGEARRYLRAELDRLAIADPPLETVMLLVSELVTNAVMHARTDMTVRYLVHAEFVRVEVTDQNTRAPAAAAAPVDATTGRGLLLLQELAARWGVEPASDGKVVWFEVPVSDSHPAADEPFAS